MIWKQIPESKTIHQKEKAGPGDLSTEIQATSLSSEAKKGRGCLFSAYQYKFTGWEPDCQGVDPGTIICYLSTLRNFLVFSRPQFYHDNLLHKVVVRFERVAVCKNLRTMLNMRCHGNSVSL